MLHVKLTIKYTVSFICSMHFLNSTNFISNQFKSNKFLCFFCCSSQGISSNCQPVLAIKCSYYYYLAEITHHCYCSILASNTITLKV